MDDPETWVRRASAVALGLVIAVSVTSRGAGRLDPALDAHVFAHRNLEFDPEDRSLIPDVVIVDDFLGEPLVMDGGAGSMATGA
jgi:hypothetical protein